jgi:uncharacterized membrane protein YecN with MAPEG domain
MEMQVPITALYAAIQAIIAFALSAPIGPMRGKLKVSIGDGGNPQLHLASRRHGNWTEHVPFALLLMALLELNGGSAAWLNGLGIALVAARIAHPLGLRADKVNSPLRIVGAVATGGVTMLTAVLLLMKAF